MQEVESDEGSDHDEYGRQYGDQDSQDDDDEEAENRDFDLSAQIAAISNDQSQIPQHLQPLLLNSG